MMADMDDVIEENEPMIKETNVQSQLIDTRLSNDGEQNVSSGSNKLATFEAIYRPSHWTVSQPVAAPNKCMEMYTSMLLHTNRCSSFICNYPTRSIAR